MIRLIILILISLSVNSVTSSTVINSEDFWIGDEDLGNYSLDQASKEYELIPRDLLVLKDPQYLKYLNEKQAEQKELLFSSSVSKETRNLLKSSNVMNNPLVENILYLKTGSSDASIDATFIIKSDKFKSDALKKYLNVAIVYFLKKQLLPFTAFMKRFQYTPECYDCLAKGTLKENKKKLMSQFPFLTLILIIARDISIIKDPMARMCIKILLETQKSALSCNEIIYMDIWLRNRDSGFIFLETYFSLYSGKSTALVKLLTNQNYKGPKTPTLIQKILAFPTFNVNVRIPFHPKEIYDMCPQNKIRDHPFYVVLLLEHTLSQPFLFAVLKDSRLVKSVPTGSLYIYFQLLDEWVHLSNRSPLFLALMFGNIWSKLHMFLHSNYYEFLVFIFQYFIYSSQLIYIIIIHLLKNITKVNKTK